MASQMPELVRLHPPSGSWVQSAALVVPGGRGWRWQRITSRCNRRSRLQAGIKTLHEVCRRQALQALHCARWRCERYTRQRRRQPTR
ncbi:hypothetical protein I552_4140 [Mycobacterium xenopi 3993]|nr:hypothetical protein I552_4140 [Mycobacterium xenopi 3993]